MHKMEELKEMLCEELDKITKKGELSAGSLDVIDKLTHSIKSIETIMAMDEYSDDYSGGYSYARGTGRNAKRDSMGRYSSDDYSMKGRYSRDDYPMRGGYSGDDMETLKEHLNDLEGMVSDNRAKKMIKEWKRELV